MKEEKITRIEIISENGREYVVRDLKEVVFSLQDRERTLKIFTKK